MKREQIFLEAGALMILALASLPVRAVAQGAKEERVKPSQFPPAVAQAIKNNCPRCTIAKASREVENGVTVYDIEFKAGQGEMDVSEDGSVIDRETVVRPKDVPPAALTAIRNAAGGGKIKQIAKDEIRAELKEGKVIKLATPKYVYEADMVKGDQAGEVQVSPEGRVTEGPEWRKRGSKEG